MLRQAAQAADAAAAARVGGSGGGAAATPPEQPLQLSLWAALLGATPSGPLAAPTELAFSKSWSVHQFLLQVRRCHGTPQLVQLRDPAGAVITDLAAAARLASGGGRAVFTLVPAEATVDAASLPSGLVTSVLTSQRGFGDECDGEPPALSHGDPLYTTLAAATVSALDVAEYRVLAHARWSDFRVQRLVSPTGACAARGRAGGGGVRVQRVGRAAVHGGGGGARTCWRAPLASLLPRPPPLATHPPSLPHSLRVPVPAQTTAACLRRGARCPASPRRASCTGCSCECGCCP